MNERLTALYRASKPKEALASQDEFKSANALLGSDVEKFAMLIIQDCIDLVDGYTKPRTPGTHYDAVEQIKSNFGIKE